MDLVDIARWINQAGLSAAPCPWLPALSIFVDEHYENFDLDMIGPKARRTIAGVLTDRGFERRGGRRFEAGDRLIELPRPNRLLSSDPVAELDRVLERDPLAALATPTQVLLATWRRQGPRLSDDMAAVMVELVHEQPANLDKVADWLRKTPAAVDFRRLRSQLDAAQAEGFEQRRHGVFRSKLPS